MYKHPAPLVAALLALLPPLHAARTLPANAPEVSIEGRTAALAGGGVRLAYPGIITRIQFTGTSLSLRARTASDELFLDVVVDGRPASFLKVPTGESDLTVAANLPEGPHSVALHKRVEAAVGILDLVSATSSGDFLPAAPLPGRRLLFLGDSFTAGQATTVEDGGPMDPSKAMRENARLSYGRLLADRLHAQAHILAYAGRGLICDWQGLRNIRLMPDFYDNAVPDDDQTRWNPSQYRPDAIVVCVGNNDFDPGIPEQVTYVQRYTEFVRLLRHDAPGALILLVTAPSLTDAAGQAPMRSVQKAYLEEVAGRLADARVKVVQIAQREGVPGDWHPSGTAHRGVADELEPVLRSGLGW